MLGIIVRVLCRVSDLFWCVNYIKADKFQVYVNHVIA